MLKIVKKVDVAIVTYTKKINKNNGSMESGWVNFNGNDYSFCKYRHSAAGESLAEVLNKLNAKKVVVNKFK